MSFINCFLDKRWHGIICQITIIHFLNARMFAVLFSVLDVKMSNTWLDTNYISNTAKICYVFKQVF
jgi:hypothetical protein